MSQVPCLKRMLTEHEHAGNEPEKGRSAILEMAHKIIAIQANNDFEAGLTYNCGVVQGGTVPNAVLEEAKLVVDTLFSRAKLVAATVLKI